MDRTLDAVVRNSPEYWADGADESPIDYLTEPRDFEVSGGIVHRVFEGGEISYYFQPTKKAIGGLAVKKSGFRSQKTSN